MEVIIVVGLILIIMKWGPSSDREYPKNEQHPVVHGGTMMILFIGAILLFAFFLGGGTPSQNYNQIRDSFQYDRPGLPPLEDP